MHCLPLYPTLTCNAVNKFYAQEIIKKIIQQLSFMSFSGNLFFNGEKQQKYTSRIACLSNIPISVHKKNYYYYQVYFINIVGILFGENNFFL